MPAPGAPEAPHGIRRSRWDKAPPPSAPMAGPAPPQTASSVHIPSGGVLLEGDLRLPSATPHGLMKGLVVFAHGSGSGRLSPRNRYVARVLEDAGLGTLLIDLLTLEEEQVDERTRHLRFDIGLLARRVADAAAWTAAHPTAGGLNLGFFGASTGAGAALLAA